MFRTMNDEWWMMNDELRFLTTDFSDFIIESIFKKFIMGDKSMEEKKDKFIEIINQIEDHEILSCLLKVLKNIANYPPFPEIPKEFLKKKN